MMYATKMTKETKVSIPIKEAQTRKIRWNMIPKRPTLLGIQMFAQYRQPVIVALFKRRSENFCHLMPSTLVSLSKESGNGCLQLCFAAKDLSSIPCSLVELRIVCMSAAYAAVMPLFKKKNAIRLPSTSMGMMNNVRRLLSTRMRHVTCISRIR
jgi:hypothetical protein